MPRLIHFKYVIVSDESLIENTLQKVVLGVCVCVCVVI